MKHRYLLPEKLMRMMAHVLESELARGRSLKEATEIAARTVNKYRARRARGVVVCKRRGGRAVLCRVEEGPRLVSQGGSHRAWYPGKARKHYACLTHERRFRTAGALRTHYRRSHGG